MKMFKVLFVFLLLLLGGYFLYSLSKSRSFQVFGEITSRVNTNQKIVALTFDDAPNSKTLEVLSVLKMKNIKATFYEVGNAIQANPAIAKAIVDAGMEVGNHSFSHQRLLFKSYSFINTEIQETNKLIRGSGYTGKITFRPPNGKKLFLLPFYLHKHKIHTVMWDVEPDTYVNQSLNNQQKTQFIVKYTTNNTHPGSIILLHPFCTSCESGRQAIPQIIDSLHSQGYRFVTVSKLLQNK